MSRPQVPRRSLAQWLDYQQSLHGPEIDLGLARVAGVGARLGLLNPAHRTVTVAGTNGKGSTVALLSGLLADQGRVGCYTSPHLWRYNERITIDGTPVADAALIDAFEAIERARGDTPLTFFEFGTLAALWLFRRAGVAVALLEVGLGGRLDAVNIIDADVAVITSIGLDHTDWLGDTREAIGTEKAGVMRRHRPAVCADRNPPATIAQYARLSGAHLWQIGRNFELITTGEHWRWSLGDATLDMPVNARVHPDNLAAALAAATALGSTPGPAAVAGACRAQAALVGRRDVIDGPVSIIYDVAHNDEAVALLVDWLRRSPVAGRTHVVLGMLADKPVAAMGRRLGEVADVFYPAALDTITPRGLSGAALAERLSHHAGAVYADPVSALAAARQAARPGDRIVVCGSFYTVGQARSPDDE